MTSMTGSHYTAPLGQLRMADVERVGGKNASLGEMISQLSGAGIRVPGGFATTAQAYRDFLSQSGLDERIRLALAALDPNDVEALARCGSQIRQWIMDTPFTPALEKDVAGAYHAMMEQEGGEVAVAVRSSATAEDLPDASFAGQQETFLNMPRFAADCRTGIAFQLRKRNVRRRECRTPFRRVISRASAVFTMLLFMVCLYR